MKYILPGLRVVRFSLSPSFVTLKKTARKNMPRGTRGHFFFLAVYFRSRSTNQAKEELLVVCIHPERKFLAEISENSLNIINNISA